MFLNENFQKEYAAYLHEQAVNEFLEMSKDLLEQQSNLIQTFDLFIELMKEEINYDGLDNSKKEEIFAIFESVDKLPEYKPGSATIEIKKLKQMGLVEAVKFFVGQVVKWIQNIVLRFIQRFQNSARGLFGLPFEDKIKKMKFSLEKTIKGLDVIPNSEEAAKVGQTRIINIKSDDIEILKGLQLNLESVEILTEKDDNEDKPERKKLEDREIKGGEVKLVQVDITKDMMDLSALVQHFLESFDLAYGSNKEHLFATDDIELLLRLFKETLTDIQHGTLPDKAIAGRLVHDTVLDPRRLRENLYRTKANVDQLTNIYGQIQTRISRTLSKIGQKQMLASASMGIGFRLFSEGTYRQMIRILTALEPRVAQINEIQLQMEQAKNVFDNLVKELGKQRQTLIGFGSVAFIDPYQKKMEDLFSAARDVSQTIGLRLGALTLFAKNLHEIYDAIETLNSMNKAAHKY